MRRPVYLLILSAFLLLLMRAGAQQHTEIKIDPIIWRQNSQDNHLIKISSQPAIELAVAFERREEMIRMRDGVRLHTLIFWPKDQAERLPIIFERTPYGIGETTSDAINQRYFHLVKDGYIFAFQDIRGRYGSEGEFMMNRPLRDKKDNKTIDETTDTYD